MLVKLLLLLVVLAPVPAAARPDPLGLGYLGVRPLDGGPPGSDLTLAVVMPHEPAARAGLQVGDTLVKVGPHTPRGFDDVREYVVGLRPGTRLDVTIRRGGKTVAVSVVVGARPTNLGAPDPFDPNGVIRVPVLPALPPPPPPNR